MKGPLPPTYILSMKSLTPIATVAAILVLALCIYAFLLGNEVFKGNFTNDPFAWYFLAKGIFCSMSLLVSSRIVDVLLAAVPPAKD